MAFPQSHYLNRSGIDRLLGDLPPEENLLVLRIRYKNKKALRFHETLTAEALKKLLIESLLNEHLPGGDLQVAFPATVLTLIGHHDGVFWLRPSI